MVSHIGSRTSRYIPNISLRLWQSHILLTKRDKILPGLLHDGGECLHHQAPGIQRLTCTIDTSTAAGRFFFHVMSALAEMERELIVERTRAGLAAAREQGRIGGRRRAMTPEVVELAGRMLNNGATRQQVADVIGVGVKTIYKYFPAG